MLNLSLRPAGPGLSPHHPQLLSWMSTGGSGRACGQSGPLHPCPLALLKQPPGIAEVTGKLWPLPARSFAPFPCCQPWVPTAFALNGPGRASRRLLTALGQTAAPPGWAPRAGTAPGAGPAPPWQQARSGHVPALGLAPLLRHAQRRAALAPSPAAEMLWHPAVHTGLPAGRTPCPAHPLQGLQERCVSPPGGRVTPQRAVRHTPRAHIPSARILPRCGAGAGGQAELLLLSLPFRPRLGAAPRQAAGEG